MFFRIWHYYCKVGVPALFGWLALVLVLGLTNVNVPMADLFGASFLVVTYILIGSGVLGGVLGLLMVLGLLSMRCPFCGNRGKVNGNQQCGMWLECPTCGVVRGGGRWGLDLIRDDEDFNGNTEKPKLKKGSSLV
jgi:hypothetical protein